MNVVVELLSSCAHDQNHSWLCECVGGLGDFSHAIGTRHPCNNLPAYPCFRLPLCSHALYMSFAMVGLQILYKANSPGTRP